MTNIKIIRAWIGYTDGVPYKYTNDHGQKEWCVFRNRADARKAFADVRRCEVVIRVDKRG